MGELAADAKTAVTVLTHHDAIMHRKVIDVQAMSKSATCGGEAVPLRSSMAGCPCMRQADSYVKAAEV